MSNAELLNNVSTPEDLENLRSKLRYAYVSKRAHRILRPIDLTQDFQNLLDYAWIASDDRSNLAPVFQVAVHIENLIELQKEIQDRDTWAYKADRKELDVTYRGFCTALLNKHFDEIPALGLKLEELIRKITSLDYQKKLRLIESTIKYGSLTAIAGLLIGGVYYTSRKAARAAAGAEEATDEVDTTEAPSA